MTNKLSSFQQILELCEISGVFLLPFSFFKKKRISRIYSWCLLDATCSKIPSLFCHFGCEGVFKSALQFCTYSSLCIHNTPIFNVCGYIRMHTSMGIYRYMHIYMYMCVLICIYTYTIMLIYIHTYKHTLLFYRNLSLDIKIYIS